MITRKNHGAPSSTTPGNVGDYYIDIDTGKVYQCVDVTTQGDDLGFVTVYANGGRSNTTYIWKSTGASSYNDLEDKPFYEEKVIVKDPLNITWDGNTEGLVQVEGAPMYKVSDLVFTDEEIKLMSMTVSGDPSATLIGDIWDEYMGRGIIATDDVTTIMIVVFVRKAGAILVEGENSITFPEAGVYSMSTGGLYLSSLTTTEPIVERIETEVKKLDPKFLPDNVGGGVKYVTISEDDGGNFTSSATYDEIAEWIRAGMDVKCTYGPLVFSLVYSDSIENINTYITAALYHRFATLMAHYSDPVLAAVYINEDGDVSYDEKALAVKEK